ncbi:MAG: hypothetical protein H6612_05820 [Ignavibacteriales bacterium]|nr:hypothetical protein [Ignavibacteriales bacterium]MCB9258857.1 hypothetical protein [Ignavibacteriales bacterium]
MRNRNHLLALVNLIFLSLFLTNTMIAQDGTLDNTFGSNGIVTTPVGSGIDIGYSVAVQSDGKILVAGNAINNSSQDFAVVRYNTNGTLDGSFGSGGKVITPIGAYDDGGYAVAVQSDGKILVAGNSYNISTSSDFAVVRYNIDGSLDGSFGTGGIVTTNIGNGDNGRSIAIQSDGKILLVGYTSGSGFGNSDIALIRYNINGTLDNTFDSDGIVTTNLGTDIDLGHSVALQSDSKIVVTGRANTNIAVVRYNANGSLDNSFDSDGIVITNLGSNRDYGQSVAIQSDNKIVVAGESNFNFAVLRYNTNGSLDNSFNSNGIVITPVGLSSSMGQSMVIQSDDKIVVAGSSHDGSGNFNEFALVKYNSNGSLDGTFGSGGITTTQVGSSHSYGYSLAIQSDGKLIVTGYLDIQLYYNTDFALVRYNNSSLSNNVVKIFLEGPFNSGTMNPLLNSSIPTTQPYSVSPWSYNGTETTTSSFITTNNIVDWVYLELRSGSSPSNATTVTNGKRAALLRNDGVILDTDGTTEIKFTGVTSGNYYLAILHRNHLPIISSQTIAIN